MPTESLRAESLAAGTSSLASALDATRSRALAGDVIQALAEADAALTSAPADPDALFTRAFVLFHWRRYIECLACSRTALDARYVHPELLRQIAACHLQLGDLEAAEASLRAALDLDPESAETLRALCTSLQRMGRWADSLPIAERCAELQPGNTDALLLCGAAHLGLQHLQVAEQYIKRATELAQADPLPWTKLGIVLSRQSRRVEAIAAFERSVEVDTHAQSNVDAFVNLAVDLHASGQADRANEMYLRNLGPAQSIAGFFNFGLARLADGSLREGWHYNEFRWLLDPLLSMRPSYQRPMWDGQPVAGKTVLIRGEQGFGDNIQFLRYAPLLKACGARVVLRPRGGMEGLAERIPGIDTVLAPDEQVEFDYYIHAMSLPRIFGTGQHPIPPQAPCIMADPDRVARWRPAIGSGAGLKVGVVWAGTPDHAHDKDRSIPLEQFGVLFDVPHIRFYSLQLGSAAQALAGHPFPNVTPLGDRIRDFGDTAAIVELLDLVICVDTAVAHLAGAMGKTVWMLNALPGDWRWRGDAESTRWYPSMRIFHQQSPGEWAAMIARVQNALAIAVPAVAGPPDTSEVQSNIPMPLDPAAQIEGLDLLGAVAETRFGIVQYLLDDSPAGVAIRWYGEHLSAHLELLGPLIPSGATIVELGTGAGLHALALSAKLGPHGHLIAYEHDQRLRTILRHNMSANRVRNVTILPDVARSTRTSPSVDDLRLTTLALIKTGIAIDASAVVAAASDTIWRLRPSVFVDAINAQAAAVAGDSMRDYGYRCWHIETPLFDVGNFNGWSDNVFGNAAAHAMLALPEEVDPGAGLREYEELR